MCRFTEITDSPPNDDPDATIPTESSPSKVLNSLGSTDSPGTLDSFKLFPNSLAKIGNEEFTNKHLSKDDSMWCEVNCNSNLPVWSNFKQNTRNPNLYRCKHCDDEITSDRAAIRYNTADARKHIAECLDAFMVDLQGYTNDPRILKINIDKRKVNLLDIKNLKIYLKRPNSLEMTATTIIKGHTELNWVADGEEAAKQSMIVETDNGAIIDEELVVKKKAVNPLNVKKTITKMVEEAKYLFRSEISTSAHLLKIPTFSSLQDLNLNIQKRLEILDTVNFFSLEFDHWSDFNRKGYMDVMLVTYEEVRDKQVSFLLDIPASEGHSSDAIVNQLDDVLSNYPGLKDIIIGMSTDNASNMLKVSKIVKDSKLFGPQYLGHIGCLLHSINIMNSCFFEQQKIKDYENKIIDNNPEVNNCDFKKKENGINEAIEEMILRLQIDTDRNTIEGTPPDYHDVQYQDLLMDNFFTGFILSENLPEVNNESQNFINYLCGNDILSKNNSIISQIGNSSAKKKVFRNLVKKILGDTNLKLRSYCKTRWLSAIETLRQIVKLKDVLMHASIRIHFRVEFTDDDFTIITNLLLFLDPFAVLCALLSSDSCTSKYTIPLLTKYEAVITDIIESQFSKSPLCSRTNTLLEKFINKVNKYLSNYYNNDTCCSAAFLTLGFSNNKFWMEKYPVDSNNRQSQSDHVCRMIAQEMIGPLVQFLNITVTDAEGTEMSSGGMFCSNSEGLEGFESFEGINSMIDQNRYIQIEPSKGVYYDSPLKSRKLNKPTRMVPTIESSRAYLHHRLIDELMKYRDLSFDNKGECRDVYWDGQNGTSLNSDFQKFGGETIGADKIFWNKYKVNFPLLSLLNRIFNNMPTTSVHAERFFSLASRVYTKRNARLSEDMFRDISYMKAFSLNINLEEIKLDSVPLRAALHLTTCLRKRKGFYTEP